MPGRDPMVVAAAAVREGKDEATIRRKVAIKLKRKAIEAAYDAAAKELGR